MAGSSGSQRGKFSGWIARAYKEDKTMKRACVICVSWIKHLFFIKEHITLFRRYLRESLSVCHSMRKGNVSLYRCPLIPICTYSNLYDDAWIMRPPYSWLSLRMPFAVSHLVQCSIKYLPIFTLISLSE